jgi:hypothetical protein
VSVYPFVLKDDEELTQWVLRRLGAPLLKVELTADHLHDNVEDAKRWFAAKKGWRRFYGFDIFPSTSEYTLPKDVDVVLDVVFAYDPLDLSILAYPYWLPPENNQIPYSVFNVAGNSGGLYSNYVQTLQFIETARRVMSAEADWRQENDKLQLFPNPTRSGKAVVEYNSHQINSVIELSERDHLLLKKYALAMAKMDLGRIRSKFDNYPTAQGTTTMDGAALLEEAKTDIEKLDEEIGESGKPMGFLVG